jgi:zinc transporter ZupT
MRINNMEIFLSLASVALLPILIVAFLPKDKSFFDRGIVKGFGLGVYLMLVFVLLSEAIESKGITYGFGFLAVGLFISLLIGIYFKEFHHHHGDEEKQEIHSKASTWRILISDFFHNIVDGIAIIAGFAISPAVGLVAFAGVLGHQIVQQIGQQILLVEEGVQAKKAILISLIVALSIFLGFFVAESMEAILLATSAGIVVWKVWTDLVHLKWDKKTATGFVAGALILLAILTSIPHQHGGEHEDEGKNLEDTH